MYKILLTAILCLNFSAIAMFSDPQIGNERITLEQIKADESSLMESDLPETEVIHTVLLGYYPKGTIDYLLKNADDMLSQSKILNAIFFGQIVIGLENMLCFLKGTINKYHAAVAYYYNNLSASTASEYKKILDSAIAVVKQSRDKVEEIEKIIELLGAKYPEYVVAVLQNEMKFSFVRQRIYHHQTRTSISVVFVETPKDK